MGSMAYLSNVPYVNIEIESSHSVAHKEETDEILELTKETDFRKMLESKVDINLKIAKILSDAMGWRLNHTTSKGNRFSVALPVSYLEVAPQDF